MTGHSHDGVSGKGSGRNPADPSLEQSDEVVVPTKVANNETAISAEPPEERTSTKRNASEEAAARSQSREPVSIRLERVRQKAEANRKERFNNLFSLLKVDLLRESFYALKRSASPGLDGTTWSQYEVDLEANLQRLEDQLHEGRYRASPVLRTYIAKPDGRQRPLGVTTVEDKVVQMAVTKLLGLIYEPVFSGFSYGGRPERSAHDALDAVSVALWRKPIHWVLDADIEGFFDHIPHAELLGVLERKVGDRRLLRLIKKWLRVGYSEDGVRHAVKVGTPQGAVISPMLGNIYLDHVLDKWFSRWREKECRGQTIIVRYVDDVVLGFQHQHEAELALACLSERLEAWGLKLHPDKTRLIEFGRYAASNRNDRGEGKPESFTFCGVDHHCSKSRKGHFIIRRKTSKKSLRKVLERTKRELRKRMHHDVHAVGRWLRSVVRGHDQYFAFPFNWDALRAFRMALARMWLKMIRRRSQKAKVKWTWKRFNSLCDFHIPPPRILHPHPSTRFDAKHST